MRQKRQPAVSTLHWWNMVRLGKGSVVRRLLHAVIAISLRLFFRRIETLGVENVPQDTPVIFVLNHPNGLIDPALVFVSLPRRVSFLAKSTLFDIPVAGRIIRLFEALPVYRRIDGSDTVMNLETFRACREMLAENRCIAIFPEGLSHDETRLRPMKTGAARIALGALGVEGKNVESLRIMAVGLYYTSKTAFRSEVLIRYGDVIDVRPAETDENGQPSREAVRELTDRIETALTKATLNLDSAEELDQILKAEALFSSVYKNLLFRESLTQSFERLQALAERYELLGRNDPAKMRALNIKILDYETELEMTGVTAEGLSVLEHPTWYVFRYLVLRILFVLLISPFAILGAVIHSPAYVFSNFIGLMFRTHGADAAGSTYKIVAAMLAMPLTWLAVALAVFFLFDWRMALVSIPLVIVCGYAALRASETLIDLTVWMRSAWLLFRQRALFLRLLLQRQTLQKEIGDLIEEEK